MVNSVKFSQFSAINTAGTNSLVGLSNGLNAISPFPLNWTTALRPVAPTNGTLGFNTSIEEYEFWNGTLSMWVQLASGGVGVTSIATGTGLTGGPITSVGTISFAPIAANSFWANTTGSTAVPTVTSLAAFLLTANDLSELIPTASVARANLGLAIGTNVEAWSPFLDQIAASTWPGAASIITVGTITTGVWQGNPITVGFGGTGNTTFTAYTVICAGTTSTGAFQNVASTGTLGQVLTSNGAGALPTWQATGSGTINAGAQNDIAYYAAAGTAISGLATANNGVLVTSNTGVPSISSTLPSAVQLNITSVGTIIAGTWQGNTIAVALGGTGNTTFTAFSVICAGTTATGAFQNVSGLGSSGQVLTSQGASALPIWANATGTGTVNSGGINDLAYYAAAGNTVSGLATANNGVLVTSNTGVPSISNTLPSAVQLNITSLGTITTGLWNGSTITVGFGGTGNTTFTAFSVICAGSTPTGAFQDVSGVGSSGQVLTSQGAGTLPIWANATGTGTVNSGTANDLAYYAASGNVVSGLASANGGTLVTSNTGVPSILSGTGTTGNILQTVSGGTPAWSNAVYPASTTLNQILYSNATNSIVGLTTANSGVLITSGAGVPSISTTLPTTVQGNITTLGTITTGVWNGTLIALANGGTNANLTASNGSLFYSTASAAALLAAGTTGQLLTISGGLPAWATQTGILLGIQFFTTSGTYTRTAGSTHQLVMAWGPGASGAGSSSATIQGPGGGAGAFSMSYVSNSSNQTVTIGTGGAGVSGNNAGNNGSGPTSFGALVIAAAGSAGSAAGTGGSGGGAGGSAASGTGSLKLSGGAGSGTGNAPANFVGHGGTSPMIGVATFAIPGAGGANAVTNSAGGGSGTDNSGTSGTGGAGLMIIWEFT